MFRIPLTEPKVAYRNEKSKSQEVPDLKGRMSPPSEIEAVVKAGKCQLETRQPESNFISTMCFERGAGSGRG